MCMLAARHCSNLPLRHRQSALRPAVALDVFAAPNICRGLLQTMKQEPEHSDRVISYAASYLKGTGLKPRPNHHLYKFS